jgi:hypothetical protein
LFQRAQERVKTSDKKGHGPLKKNETYDNNRQYSHDHEDSYLSSDFDHSDGIDGLKRSVSSNIPFNFEDIQTRLKVSRQGDIFEEEADRIAEQVVNSKLISNIHEAKEVKTWRNANPRISSRQIEQDEGYLQNIEGIVNDQGSHLDSSMLSFMESRFGYDFSQVRIHADAESAKSARALGARAFTLGQDIVFDPDYYSATSYDGRKLIAHELSHVIQQSQLNITHYPDSANSRTANHIKERNLAGLIQRQALERDKATLRLEELKGLLREKRAERTYHGFDPNEDPEYKDLLSQYNTLDAQLNEQVSRVVPRTYFGTPKYRDKVQTIESPQYRRALLGLEEESTDFEKQLKSDVEVKPLKPSPISNQFVFKSDDFSPIADPNTGEITSYIRYGVGGYYEVYDRDGRFFGSGEPGIEPSLIQPTDFIPAGLITAPIKFAARKGGTALAGAGGQLLRAGRHFAVRTKFATSVMMRGIEESAPVLGQKLAPRAVVLSGELGSREIAEQGAEQGFRLLSKEEAENLASTSRGFMSPTLDGLGTRFALEQGSKEGPQALGVNVPKPTTVMAGPAIKGPQDLLQKYSGRLKSEGGALEEMWRRGGNPDIPVHRRAASHEIHTLVRYLEHGSPDGRAVARLDVIPSRSGTQSPDFVVHYSDGTLERLEVTAVTSGARGTQSTARGTDLVARERLAEATLTRSNVLAGDIGRAIMRKATGRQLLDTLAEVPQGGSIVVHVTFGSITPSIADQAVASVANQIGPAVSCIEISFLARASPELPVYRVVRSYRRSSTGAYDLIQ